jgi:ribosome-binding protein aMBF1 (putative translation factor)
MDEKKELRPLAVREQVTRVLLKAQKIAGGREELAKRLGVEPRLIGEWLARRADAPDDVVQKALDVILDIPRPKY